MAADLTTDSMAAHVREANRANPALADVTRVPADEFAALICGWLPHLDPRDIAAVLLHTSSFLATTLTQFRGGGLGEERAATCVINIVAHAGERMDRKARRTERRAK